MSNPIRLQFYECLQKRIGFDSLSQSHIFSIMINLFILGIYQNWWEQLSNCLILKNSKITLTQGGKKISTWVGKWNQIWPSELVQPLT